MTVSNIRLGSAVVAIVVVAIAATALLQAKPDQGPLAQDATTKDVVPADPGVDVTFGQLVISNPTADVATITAISLIDPTPGLVVLGISTIRRGDPPPTIVGTGFGYPPSGFASSSLQSPPGTQVRPAASDKPWAESIEVLVGVRAPAAGQFGFSGIALDYSIGGKAYTASMNQGLELCAPEAALTAAGCSTASP